MLSYWKSIHISWVNEGVYLEQKYNLQFLTATFVPILPGRITDQRHDWSGSWNRWQYQRRFWVEIPSTTFHRNFFRIFQIFREKFPVFFQSFLSRVLSAKSVNKQNHRMAVLYAFKMFYGQKIRKNAEMHRFWSQNTFFPTEPEVITMVYSKKYSNNNELSLFLLQSSNTLTVSQWMLRSQF